MSEGQEIKGRILSATFTVKLQPEVFPAASVATHETVVRPSLKTTLLRVFPVPDEAPERVKATLTPVQLSDAVASHAVPEWTYVQPDVTLTFC
jgi:hypothetical protein